MTDVTTRERILEAALAAFASRGYQGASTREIAAAASSNQGLIKYYFDSKQALWQEVMTQAFLSLERTLHDAYQPAAQLPTTAQLQLLMRAFVQYTAQSPGLHRLVVHACSDGGERLDWLTRTLVRPLLIDGPVPLLAMIQGTGLCPAGVQPEQMLFAFIGASAHVFAVAPMVRDVHGVDPNTPASVDAHTQLLLSLFLRTPHQDLETKRS